jgi:hypothetical protein
LDEKAKFENIEQAINFMRECKFYKFTKDESEKQMMTVADAR